MYTKIITSGNIVETYEYEKEPATRTDSERRKLLSAEDREEERRIRVQVEKEWESLGQREKPEDSIFRKVANGRRSDNCTALRNNFRRVVFSNLCDGQTAFLITLTYKESEKVTAIEKAYIHLKRFHDKKLRRKFGKDFSYIVVPEFQERGAVHFHGIYFGLPVSVVSERYSRAIAKMWRLGYVDVVLTDGSTRMAEYLSKYMVQSVTDIRLSGQKGFVCSRNIKRPIVVQGETNLRAEDILGVDSEAVLTREYETQWMGRAIYKLYNNQEHENKKSQVDALEVHGTKVGRDER